MEALCYEPLEGTHVRCRLCGHACRIPDGKRGICGVRENRGGTLYTRVYGELVARSIDPIEKKPIFHLLPGSTAFSIATVGCNFRCRFCQNADIAQMPADHGGQIRGAYTPPETVVVHALKSGSASIAYTYTEPTVYFEFMRDTARLATGAGLKNIMVTNGYMSPEALALIAPDLDAANVDLKAFSDTFYQNRCGARLQPVLDTLTAMKSFGILVEVTTLIIPGENDDPGELSALANFIAGTLGPETPWHISRFHPAYRLTDRPATPVSTLETAFSIGKAAGLHYIYTGNVPGRGMADTFCPGCGACLISRHGFFVSTDRMGASGICPDCGCRIHGVFSRESG